MDDIYRIETFSVESSHSIILGIFQLSVTHFQWSQFYFTYINGGGIKSRRDEAFRAREMASNSAKARCDICPCRSAYKLKHQRRD